MPLIQEPKQIVVSPVPRSEPNGMFVFRETGIDEPLPVCVSPAKKKKKTNGIQHKRQELH